MATGGPGNMVIAYGLVCSCVWAVLQTLAEMTIAFPTSGNYIDYADRWVDPALAFGAGFAEWLGNGPPDLYRSPELTTTFRLDCDSCSRSIVLQHSPSVLGIRQLSAWCST